MKRFKADLVSGWEGCVFLSCVCAEVARKTDETDFIKYGWYAGVVDIINSKNSEYINLNHFKNESEKVLKFLLKDRQASYFWNRVEDLKRMERKFIAYSRKVLKMLPTLDDMQLELAYNKFMEEYIGIFGKGALTFVYESFLSEDLVNSISTRNPNASEIIEQVIKVRYESFMVKSERLLTKIYDEGNLRMKNTLVEKYKKDFFFIKSNYNKAKVLTDTDIRKLATHKIIYHKKSKRIKMDLTQKERLIVEVLKPTIIIRDIRKKINLIGDYVMYRFLEEVSIRSGVSKQALRNVFWTELFNVFKKRGVEKELKGRRYVTFVYDNGKVFFERKIIVSERHTEEASSRIIGIPASKGVARGSCCIIHGPEEFSKFKNGNILVTYATRPDFLPIMKRAAAIVTQEGGITNHAAIVARELGIPCIVGVNSLLSLLKDRQFVEVNANKGEVMIKIGRKWT